MVSLTSRFWVEITVYWGCEFSGGWSLVGRTQFSACRIGVAIVLLPCQPTPLLAPYHTAPQVFHYVGTVFLQDTRTPV